MNDDRLATVRGDLQLRPASLMASVMFAALVMIDAPVLAAVMLRPAVPVAAVVLPALVMFFAPVVVLARIDLGLAFTVPLVVLTAFVMFPATIVILAFVDFRPALLVAFIVFPTFVVVLAAVVIFAVVDFRFAVAMSFLVLATFIMLLAFVMAVTFVASSFTFPLAAVTPLAFSKNIGCVKKCDSKEGAEEKVQKTSTKLDFHRSTSSDFFPGTRPPATGQPFFPRCVRDVKQEFANRAIGVVTHSGTFSRNPWQQFTLSWHAPQNAEGKTVGVSLAESELGVMTRSHIKSQKISCTIRTHGNSA